MSTATSPAVAGTEFIAKDPTKRVAITLSLISVVLIWYFWPELTGGDKVTTTILGSILCGMFALGIGLSRRAAKHRIVVEASGLRLEAGSKVRAIGKFEILRLVQRRVRAGNNSYTAFFAVLMDGTEERLFVDGTYPEQPTVLSAIAQMSGRNWEKE